MSTTVPTEITRRNQVSRRTVEKARYADFQEPEDRRVLLRVKVRNLMQEAQLIRRKEQGHPRSHQIRAELRIHRVKTLRQEARAAQLALVFLRGKHAYHEIERTVRADNPPAWDRVERLVLRYGEPFSPTARLNHQQRQEVHNELRTRLHAWKSMAPSAAAV